MAVTAFGATSTVSGIVGKCSWGSFPTHLRIAVGPWIITCAFPAGNIVQFEAPFGIGVCALPFHPHEDAFHRLLVSVQDPPREFPRFAALAL